jgi:hypothetical protein
MNLFQHCLKVVQHFMVPESQHLVTQRFEVDRSLLILRDLVKVLPSIDLDNQFDLQTQEIDDARINGLLATKLET